MNTQPCISFAHLITAMPDTHVDYLINVYLSDEPTVIRLLEGHPDAPLTGTTLTALYKHYPSSHTDVHDAAIPLVGAGDGFTGRPINMTTLAELGPKPHGPLVTDMCRGGHLETLDTIEILFHMATPTAAKHLATRILATYENTSDNAQTLGLPHGQLQQDIFVKAGGERLFQWITLNDQLTDQDILNLLHGPVLNIINTPARGHSRSRQIKAMISELVNSRPHLLPHMLDMAVAEVTGALTKSAHLTTQAVRTIIDTHPVDGWSALSLLANPAVDLTSFTDEELTRLTAMEPADTYKRNAVNARKRNNRMGQFDLTTEANEEHLWWLIGRAGCDNEGVWRRPHDHTLLLVNPHVTDDMVNEMCSNLKHGYATYRARRQFITALLTRYPHLVTAPKGPAADWIDRLTTQGSADRLAGSYPRPLLPVLTADQITCLQYDPQHIGGLNPNMTGTQDWSYGWSPTAVQWMVRHPLQHAAQTVIDQLGTNTTAWLVLREVWPPNATPLPEVLDLVQAVAE